MNDARRENGLPARPAESAPAHEWMAYAQALEGVASAGERRADFLHARLNELAASPAFRLARTAKKLMGGRLARLPAEPARVPQLKGRPLVSVLIPFRDGAKLLARCLKTFQRRTHYTHVEFVLIDNGSRQASTARLLEREASKDNTRVLRSDEPFNYARLNNLGAESARGDFLLLLNNDIEILHAHWLELLLEQAEAHDVGAVGARLVYPDGRIQHAGVSLKLDDIAGYPYRLLGSDDPAVVESRAVDAVTGACLLTPRTLYQSIGGLDEKHLAVAYNDVDYCLRLRERGLKTVYAAEACLLHHESISRGHTNDPAEAAYMVRRWGHFLAEGAGGTP
jgi:O-antigen biosynthesis protein